MNEELRPTHPGIVFKKEVIEALPRMTVSIAAKSLGVSKAHLGQVIKGKARITANLAFSIGITTDTDPMKWLGMQSQYDLFELRQNESIINSVVKNSLTV